MGSTCCRQSEIISANQESELMDIFDMKIDQEIYPLKVHKGFRNILQKKKQMKQIDEDSSLTFLQNELNKYTKHHDYNQTIIYSEYLQQQENVQIKIKKLKSIIKPRTLYHLTSSSTRLNSQLKNQESQFKRRQRILSDKKVRFKIPKQHKKPSHSCSISNYRSGIQINLINCHQTRIGLF
ncbi:unnamed protein product [Paramecium primaurelia]|uniref:Uncharacterized protein n=1 Tax=Paramecium primaurelia TaxID=5886 RepID=A0A8S1JME9_PARPR|nr:unnamed protein product [Paramecium primaurelia]